MTRRARPLRCGRLAPLLAAAALGCGAQSEAPADPRPNIVLVSIDSLRADHLGAYGYERDTSPMIDRLAAGGVRFDQASSTTSWTLPAHAALFTGLPDAAHGLVGDGLRLAEAQLTLAEVLRDAGWHTAGIFGGPYLHPTFGLAQGFEHYASAMTWAGEGVDDERVRGAARRGAGSAHADVTGPRTVERVEAWLEQLDERPFFLFLHLWDVHYDYVPPRRFVERFDPGYTGSLDPSDFLANPGIGPDMDPRDRAHLIARYDGEIRFTDEILGEILALLEAEGRLANAIVAVTADHGDEFFEHGGKGHRRTLFEEVVRVPLVLYAPGRLPPGRVVTTPVSLVDVMPTLLSLAGVPRRGVPFGRDLGRLARGERAATRPALLGLVTPRASMRALRGDDFKLIEHPNGTLSYYDLARDPGERERVEPTGEAEDAARTTLAAAAAAAESAREAIGAAPVEPVDLAPALEERLRALGYLEP